MGKLRNPIPAQFETELEQEVKKRLTYFCVIPVPVLLDANISDKAKVTYGVLSGCADNFGYIEYGADERAELALKLSRSTRAISQAVNELIERGYIAIEGNQLKLPGGTM
ncbi:MAG: helix-turn-helix domain-containing protein [Firmicutes bacterium]|nr:helix-turn-helix domain-containing protein [Bacillota bacterium]